MWPQTRVSARLGIRVPILQGPLGGLPAQRLVAAVSNAGGLGSFGGLGLSSDALRDVIGELRSLTQRPFAVNLWVSTADDAARTSDAAAFARALASLAPALESLGGTRPTHRPSFGPTFEEQARVLLDERVPAFSFIFGIPPREILDECRARGIATLGTATTADEAIALERAHVDVIVAVGAESGGHRGSFLRSSEESATGTLALVPQVVDAVSAPVVAAGGIADARGIVAALALGAEGVQIGTAFVACEESGASALYRAALLGGNASRTALTRGFTGRLARGLDNELLRAVNAPGAEILPYPLQRALTRAVTDAAERAGRPEWIQMWAGQSANLTRSTKASELMEALVAGVDALLAELESRGR
jgi:nitronate monooxygenase